MYMNPLPLFRLLLALLLGASLSAPSLAADYQPILPKTGPTERVLVLDASVTKKNGNRGTIQFETLSSASLQGLINRDSTTKIFIKNLHTRIFMNPESDDLKTGGGKGDAYALMLEQIPYPQETVQLKETETYPVLLWLMENYADRVKGYTLVKQGWHHKDHGAIAAAINSCTFESLLPVTPHVRNYLRSKGFNKPVVYDLTEMDNATALDWSMEKYLHRPDVNRSVINYVDNYYDMNDYFVAVKAYSFSLTGKGLKGVEDHEEPKLIGKLLNKDNFPLGTLVIGDSEGPHMITPMQKEGYQVICGHISNCSVTSSIPTNPQSFRPAAAGVAHPIDPNAAYISFSGNDGDAIDFGLYVGAKNLANDPMAGHVPMSWKINPVFIDLFPTLYAWHTHQYPETVQLAASLNDGGAPHGEEGFAEWCQMFRHWIDHSNSSLRHFVYLGSYGVALNVEKFFASTGGHYTYRGYDSRPGFGRTQWKRLDGMVLSNLVGQAFHNPQQTAAEARKSITQFDTEGQPVFIMIRLGIDNSRHLNARRGTIPFTMAHEVQEALSADPNIQRKLIYLSPADLATTYKAWAVANQIPGDHK